MRSLRMSGSSESCVMRKHKKNSNYCDSHVILAKYYSCMSGAGNKFKLKFRSTSLNHFFLSVLGHF